MTDRTSSGSSSRRTKPGGDSIGQFVIDQEIGKGSFAQVYSGKHKVTGALVAIKSVDVAKLNKKLKENLYGEIKILKTLRHPHIVALHDCVESPTYINLIMEYCELGDLSLFIKKREKLITNPATHDIARKYPNAPNSGLNEVVTRHFLQQLASAIKFLREGNFVHRDVKPQNLLLLPSPQYREANKTVKQILSASHDSLIPIAGLASLPMLKLADFGFARVLPSTSLAETLCGSPLYMAPEILRYERYDAKADLWSVGTVLYEMVTGRPPFRASNHVELLRKIENADDNIKFPREAIVTAEMKHLIRGLLKRSPVERMSFESFFAHTVVASPIPGLVEDDLPQKEDRRSTRDIRAATRSEEPAPSPIRRSSFRKQHTTDYDSGREGSGPVAPRSLRSSPLATPVEAKENPLDQVPTSGTSYSGREGLGIQQRPRAQPSTSAPARPPMYMERKHRPSNASLRQPEAIRETPSPASSRMDEPGRGQGKFQTDSTGMDSAERAAQEIAFERDYVVVEKRQVEVNAFADELDARQLTQPHSLPSSKAGQMVRRATQQGNPTSTTGAVAAATSRNTQIAQGKMDHYRQASYDKSVAGSPGSGPSSITKAIQDASLRLFGFKYAPQVFGKGASPPQLYNPFPAYPTPPAPVGMISDGKQSAPVDEDARVAQCIEDYATRSDVVYGFAEVKYKQLVPLAPSMEHGLGGLPADRMASDDDLGLTVEAIVSLSEEALVLYVKALSLLAKSMDIASLWWSRKSRTEPTNNGHAREYASGRDLAMKINGVVQWIRARFNEVLEKAEIVRLKLMDAQKQLPEDHPSHPSNRPVDSAINSSSAEGVFLTSGISAEKLMYERAVEMSRTAAINEISNDDLPGCELSYVTAIRMLEAVLDHDDDLPKRRSMSGSSKEVKLPWQVLREDISSDMNADDQQDVRKVIQMITSRLATVRKKMRLIEAASRAQQQQYLARRRSGDVTPRSVPS